MGNIQAVSPTQESILQFHKERIINEAAYEIERADIFLLSVGAGFSADSGLAVYKDIANVPIYQEYELEYHDLCDPIWIKKDPAIFYGFWGKCFNDYRLTKPHEGYQIIDQWKQKFFSNRPSLNSSYFPNEFARLNALRQELKLDCSIEGAGPFFIFSSNVDGHPIKAGFKEHELFEIHGSLENWQCSKNCLVPRGKEIVKEEDPEKPLTWRPVRSFLFRVNEEKMLVEKALLNKQIEHPETLTEKIINGFSKNQPKCIHCGAPARPNVLMFNDATYYERKLPGWRYSQWLNLVLEYCSMGKKLVILEIGSGANVPTVRMQSESKFICDQYLTLN